MAKYIIRYGIDQVEKELPSGQTIGQLVSNPNIKAGLGFGDNVKAVVMGTELPKLAIAPENTVISVETACNSKATN